MHWLSDAIFWSAVALFATVAVFWIAAAYRIVRELLGAPTLAEGLRAEIPEAELPPVTIIVPAHNEESCLGDLLESLLHQRYPQLRVRVALDRCTDGTEEIVRRAAAKDKRLEAITIDDCPPGLGRQGERGPCRCDQGRLPGHPE